MKLDPSIQGLLKVVSSGKKKPPKSWFVGKKPPKSRVVGEKRNTLITYRILILILIQGLREVGSSSN